MMITDIHCHVLPGLDDGPATMAESIAVLEEAWNQGIGTMIVTPHFHPGRYTVTADRVLETLEEVKRRASEEGISVRLLPGQECYYFSGLLKELEMGNALTMAGTDFVLVEFEPDVQYSALIRTMREMRDHGYRPIIAHFERCGCLYRRLDRFEELRKYGALLQMNFDRLLDREALFHRNPWRKLLADGYVDFLGSDTHGMKLRPLHAARAMQWLNKSVGEAIRTRILESNIEMLLET